MQAGNKIRMNPSFDPAFADLNVFSKEYYNRWLNPGDERKTNIPVIPSQDLIRNIGKENIEKPTTLITIHKTGWLTVVLCV